MNCKYVPSSFCTISTFNCHHELYGLLLSLSIHHPSANIICVVDLKTKIAIESYQPQPRLNIQWEIILDQFSELNRKQMENQGIWTKFQMMKATAIEIAVKKYNDTLFLDSDIIIFDVIDTIDKTKQIGVSPHYIKKVDTDKFGFYNGGVLWTNQSSLSQDWNEFSKTSRFYDQASIENLVDKYDHFEFDESHNLSWWRMFQSDESPEIIKNYFSIKNNKIYYKDKCLKFVHNHFHNNHGIYGIFNNIIINLLRQVKDYKHESIIFRMIQKRWIITIPKQPINGIFSHNNDSFRELVYLINNKFADIELIINDKHKHCWLLPNTILYDRPTIQWCNDEMKHSSLVLIGNGSKDDCEIDYIKNTFQCSSDVWLFWPRYPTLLEKTLICNSNLNYNERNYESIFIGNYENEIQRKFRETSMDWKSVIKEFHNTKGTTHKFTPEEYLNKIRNSKFGLCLRGFGSKCHREVELMAFGTIPLVTQEVSITSYIDPPIENKHYILVNDPEDLKEKIENITENQWKIMSKACSTWYLKNIHSDQFFNKTINHIIYS